MRTRLATLLIAAIAAVFLAGPARAAEPPGSGWTHRVATDLSRGDLGLPAGAAPSTLGRAALRRLAPKLGLGRSLRGVRLARAHRLPGARGRLLRFQQTAGGVRIVWSRIDVTIASGRVRSVGATVVPLASDRLAGGKRIGRGRAMAIARRAVLGAEEASPPALVAYAGKPGAIASAALAREPRLAFVVATTPRSRLGDETPTPVCVIVDAQTGRVLTRWDGIAELPPPAAPPAPLAAGSTTLIEIWDESVQPPVLYARWETTEDPFVSSSWVISGSRAKARVTYAGARNGTMDALTANAFEVAKYVCSIDHYCGRYGSLAAGNGVYWPWEVFGLGPERSNADPRNYDVSINRGDITNEVPGDAQRNDAVAHEYGHIMDWVYAGDRLFTDEGKEVQEALADMFDYDADSHDAASGEDILGGPVINWANPGAIVDPVERVPYPAAMSQYRCNAEVHHNGTILSHAFHRFRQGVSTNDSVAHHVSGRVLQQVPAFLAPEAKFYDVKRGFIELAGRLFPVGQSPLIPNAGAAAQQAFADAGGPQDPRC